MSNDKIYHNNKTYYSKRLYDSRVRKIKLLEKQLEDYQKCKTYSEIEVLNKKYIKVTKK